MISAGQESAFLIAHPLPTPTACGFDAVHPWTTLGEMLTYIVKTQNCLIIGIIQTPTREDVRNSSP